MQAVRVEAQGVLKEKAGFSGHEGASFGCLGFCVRWIGLLLAPVVPLGSWKGC